MNVLFCSSEVSPFVKVGGLADVVGSLPIALKRLGVDARVLIPRYEHLATNPILKPTGLTFTVEAAGKAEKVRIFETTLPDSDIIVYLLENETYLSHGSVYNQHGTDDPFLEISRFLFFSRAAVTAIKKLDWTPDVLHCHDWCTALLPSFAKLEKTLAATPTLVTIHNLAHQAVWNDGDIFKFLGEGSRALDNFSKRDSRGDFNFLQQGVLNATGVNTVSPTYAKEILTHEYGERLENDLRSRQSSLVGILNGIDINIFNPATDPAIRVHYTSETIEKKRENTLALHERCGFPPDASVPTFAFIGRLAEQKGTDLLVEISERLVQAGARLVVLGTGLENLEKTLTKLAEQFPHQVYCRIGFDAAFAQLIYAGADALLMPSKFEPCGLGQLIAMRYGTVPIVRSTGGLKDTVTDVTDDPKGGTGFTFTKFSADALWRSVSAALKYYADRQAWHELARRGMQQDHSWDASAREYINLYEHLDSKK